MYITTNVDDLLADALRSAGREPREQGSQWQAAYAAQTPQVDDLPLPSGQQPRVIQMFGHLRDKKSLVLTEDDYFEYLIGLSRYYARPQPSILLEKLTDAGLMFLGFRIDDWDFRVLIHLLQSLQGSKLRGFYKNVAVQVDPEQGSGADLTKIRAYLEKYFGAPAMQIEIYWGSAEDFLNELAQRWNPSD